MSKRLLVSLPWRAFNPRQETQARHLKTQLYLARYTRRLQVRQQALLKRSRFWSWLRLGIFLLGFTLTVLCFSRHRPEWGWFSLGLSSLMFFVAVRIHQTYQKSLFRYQILLNHLREQDMRLERNWRDLPVPPEPQLEPEHPFAKDLDLLGPASLMHLTDTCISQEGSQTLADWLTQRIPEPLQISYRQDLVKNLLGRTLFRQGLLLRGAETAWEFRHVHKAGKHWQASELLGILQRYPEHSSPGKALAGLTSLALIHWFFHGLAWLGWVSPLFWQIPLSLYIVGFWLARGQTKNLFQEAFQMDFEVRKLSKILGWLENWAKVPDFKLALHSFAQVSPSALFKRLGRVVPLASLQTNPLAWLMLNLALPCDFFAAWQLARIKPLLYTQLPKWISSLAELEAAAALANLAWLHPEWQFPVLVPSSTDTPILSAQALGHPLLPPAKRIRNGFQIQHSGQVFLLTGSNMAGKSTFIKSIGVNLALAQAGGAVDAETFSFQPVRLFGCIRVSDSVTDGFSYFYAEVRRLKQLLDALNLPQAYPVLWLIDEIFRGTNNRERFLGSKAYIEALLEKNGTGLISTHDLELTQVAPERIQNFHFREQIVGQDMYFDYLLQTGPCPTTNALKIMALEGLPVPELTL